jgi:hypothetical protein
MIFLAMLLAAAAVPDRFVLMDETVQVPAASWRDYPIELRQRPALVECSFSVEGGGSGVRVALMQRAEVERLRAGQRHHVLAATGYERAQRFRFPVPAGDYSIVVDNRLEGRGPADVHLRVALAFTGPEPEAQVLSPARRASVVAASILFFLAVAFFAGRKLKKAVLDRRPPPGATGSL